MKSTIRVLQIIVAPKPPPGTEGGVGGPERRAANLINQWRAHNIEPVVCYPKRGRLWSHFGAPGVPLVDFEIDGKADVGAISRIANIAKSQGARLIHTQGPASLDLLAGLASRVARIPFVMTRPVMLEDERHRSRARMRIYRTVDAAITLKLPTQIIAVSMAGFEHLATVCHVPRNNLRLIHNGIDLARFVTTAATNANGSHERPAVRIGMVAQLTPPKGWYDFIAVMANLRETGLAVRGLIVGEGELRSELESLVASRGLTEIIEFLGFMSDVAPTLRSLDILLFTSHREGLSVAILEAMATGLPIIATDVGGTREQVISNQNGYLCAPGDIDTLTSKALELAQAPETRARMGRTSREFVEQKFSELRMLKDYVDCYREVAW